MLMYNVPLVHEPYAKVCNKHRCADGVHVLLSKLAALDEFITYGILTNPDAQNGSVHADTAPGWAQTKWHFGRVALQMVPTFMEG